MILASIKPYYYYLIGEGIKKIEVRKSTLKNLPKDIAFYMSKDEKSFAKIPKEFQEKYRKHFGKVGMQVICEKIDKYTSLLFRGQEFYQNFTTSEEIKANLSLKEMRVYGKGKPIYGWHISDLKIYDKPKELSEFNRPCPITNRDCEKCLYYGKPYTWDFDEETGKIFCTRKVIRPPQSYMFVEEV